MIQPVKLVVELPLNVLAAIKDSHSMEIHVQHVLILRPWLALKRMLLIHSPATEVTP